MRTFKIAVLTVLCILFYNITNAQNEDAVNTYTPYSFYGIGDLKSPGFAAQRGMGGIGIGLRTNRSINYVNPAALSAQDTLSFMFDFGAEMQNYYISTNESSSASNSFNMSHISMSFPVWNKMVVALSVLPYSSVGYKVQQNETDPTIINTAGDITYSNQGEGGLNQLMLSLGYSLKGLFPHSPVLSRFSIGGQAQYIFGTIDRYSNVLFNTNQSITDVNAGYHIKASDFAFGLGLQYDMPIGKNHLTFGATYQFKNNMGVKKINFAYRIWNWGSDTTRYNVDNNAHVLVPAALGLGITYRHEDQWTVGLDYTYRDWRDATFDVPENTPVEKTFKAMSEHVIRAGFETTPNRYDIRYFLKRWTYRGGLYYENTYMQFGDTRIKNYGITFGVGVPIGARNNAVNISAELGQRGTHENDLIRELYWKVSLSVSLYDIWFIKQKFE